MYLLIATRNPDKLQEIRACFTFGNLDLGSALDYPHLPDVVEDGETLEANALKKATELAIQTDSWALADDTGLEVDALHGAPGVYAARYAGENVTYADNVAKLLKEMGNQSTRTARFRTVVALSDPQAQARWVEGLCHGTILDHERGDRGFGYDPVFLPDGHTATFAEMDTDTKNRISHRGLALQAAKTAWQSILKSENPAWT